MTGHRNEASVRSYARDTPDDQKKVQVGKDQEKAQSEKDSHSNRMSRTLTDLSNGEQDKRYKFNTTPKLHTAKTVTGGHQLQVPPAPSSNKPTPTANLKRDFEMNTGFFNPASCTFTNCSFTMNHKS